MRLKGINNKIKRKFSNLLAKESNYHFLVRDWKAINDIEVLEKFFGTDFFKNELESISPNLDHYNKVLLLSPHQDDESIGAGGLLTQLNKKKTEITIVYMTDGSEISPGHTAQEVIELRFKEVDEALKNINVKINKIQISNIKPQPNEDNILSLSQIINNAKPDLILVPWFLDTPVKHRMVNHLLKLSDIKYGLPTCEIWGYQVHNHLYPNIVIDITDEMDEKMRMIQSFHSQLSRGKAYDLITQGMNAYNAKYLQNAKYVETFFGLPSKDYLNLINDIYKVSLKKVYKNDEALYKHMEALENKIN